MNPFEPLSDDQLLALCMYGEARNQGLDGMLAVGFVVINRVTKNGWFGKGIRGVVLKPLQFSCFNESDPNCKVLSFIAGGFVEETSRDSALRAAYWVSMGIHDGYLRSNVQGATHYHAVGIHPSWADSLVRVCQIKDHVFYVEDRG
jgi:spore germination cell wall hydrolase CwlJ-like protein